MSASNVWVGTERVQQVKGYLGGRLEAVGAAHYAEGIRTRSFQAPLQIQNLADIFVQAHDNFPVQGQLLHPVRVGRAVCAT